MTRREPWLVLVLSLFTCGIYGMYWHFVSTEELKTLSGRTDISGLTDLLLGFVTCGLWYFYAEYRNAQIVHDVLTQRSVPHEDRSQIVLILDVLVFVIGATGLVARMILQDEYNKLAPV